MQLQLASTFQNHAVLQRDQPVPVWGWSRPLTRLRVLIANREAHCMSNACGEWMIRLPPLATGGPHVLTVESFSDGECIRISDLLVGEVWLASGQSNMEWTLSQCLPVSEQDIHSANDPEIRFFTIEKRADHGTHRTLAGSWKIASPENAPGFSAVAYAFARELRRTLDVPVGVISSACGSSVIQTWISRPALAQNPDLSSWLATYESQAFTPERWAFADRFPDGKSTDSFFLDPGVTQDWHVCGLEESSWSEITLPSTWQQAGHDYSGVFWFRCSVHIPENWVGKDLLLNLGGADKQDITYVNGMEVGRTGKGFEYQHWNLPRRYTVPAAVVTGTTLTIASRVFSFVHGGGLIGPADTMTLVPEGSREPGLPLAGPWRFKCEHNLGRTIPPVPPLGHGEQNSPHMLFDNMIAPLVPYALRGALWYQGESNTAEHSRYADMLEDLIRDWRYHWGQPAFSFHIVQLPRHRAASAHQPDSTWARLREAQATALALPDVGIAVTIDLGMANDLHPSDKVPVGRRLARSALARTYHYGIPPNGPVFKNAVAVGSIMYCYFRYAEGGLFTLDGAAPCPFSLAGTDRVFHPADARIDGSRVVVTSEFVASPVAVRYAWADNPEGCNLGGAGSLPAAPFRSDHW